MIQFIRTKRFLSRIARHAKPRRRFVLQTRELFMTKFQNQFPFTEKSIKAPFPYFIRGVAVGIAIMALVGGVTAYADQQNVSPTNVLYPLKRVNENLQLAFVSENKKPEYHAKLAERRSVEIETLANNDLEKRAEELAIEMSSEIDKSLAILEVVGVPKHEPVIQTVRRTTTSFASTRSEANSFFTQELPFPSFEMSDDSENGRQRTKIVEVEHPACQSISKLLKKRSESLERAFKSREKLEERFKKICEREEEEND